MQGSRAHLGSSAGTPRNHTEKVPAMIPDSYKIAFAALDAIWREHPSESLAIMLGGMAINPNDNVSMDPGVLDDWQHLTAGAAREDVLSLILAYLDLDASRYRKGDVPDDLRHLIDALHQQGTPERGIVDRVIATWHLAPDSWRLYAKLTRLAD